MARLHTLALFALIAVCGCGMGGSPGARPAAAEVSRKLLESALDAWKQGKVKDLAGLQPPIRLVDPDQSAGRKLEGYRVKGEPTTVGHALDFPVALTIRDAKGKSRDVQAVYQVTAEPDAAVLRNDP